MQKRSIALKLSLILFIGLISLGFACGGVNSVYALENSEVDVWINGVKIASEESTSLGENKGSYKFDKTSNELTLTNATIGSLYEDSGISSAIYSKIDNLTIKLVGENCISLPNSSSGDVYGLYSTANVRIVNGNENGLGSLIIKASSSSPATGIKLAGEVVIQKVNVSIKTYGDYGIQANSMIANNDGTKITISDVGCGISYNIKCILNYCDTNIQSKDESIKAESKTSYSMALGGSDIILSSENSRVINKSISDLNFNSENCIKRIISEESVGDNAIVWDGINIAECETVYKYLEIKNYVEHLWHYSENNSDTSKHIKNCENCLKEIEEEHQITNYKCELCEYNIAPQKQGEMSFEQCESYYVVKSNIVGNNIVFKWYIVQSEEKQLLQDNETFENTNAENLKVNCNVCALGGIVVMCEAENSSGGISNSKQIQVEHNIIEKETIPATKDSVGYKAHKECSNCGNFFNENGEEISKSEVEISKLSNEQMREGTISSLDENAESGIPIKAIGFIVLALMLIAVFAVIIKTKKQEYSDAEKNKKDESKELLVNEEKDKIKEDVEDEIKELSQNEKIEETTAKNVEKDKKEFKKEKEIKVKNGETNNNTKNVNNNNMNKTSNKSNKKRNYKNYKMKKNSNKK